MATITLKNIPAATHQALKQRAERHGRSLNKEVLACLEAAIRPQRVDTEALLAAFQRHRASLPGKLDDALIRTARASGRP